eukprot:s8279_g5.t1
MELTPKLGTTATTTEAFQWAHVNPVLMPQWKQSKSLGREGFWHLWRHGAFTASEVTATSAKRGVRFKATWDTVIMIGLSHGNANDWYWDIDYSMYVHTHWRRLWGRRGPRGWWGNRFLGSHRWSGGDRDIFEVRLNSDRSRVEYVVNRRVLWTAPETAWFPMNIDASVWRGALYDVSWVCDGGCSEEHPALQVLLMFEHYFKTNEEAGSLYSIEDLLKVQLCGDDLSTFNRNWESVIAGLNHQPEETTLRDILLRQLRNASKLKFDLEVYDRAKEGSEQHTYDYLVKCVKEFWIGLVRIEQPLKKLTEQSSEPQHFPNRTLPAKGAKKPR